MALMSARGTAAVPGPSAAETCVSPNLRISDVLVRDVKGCGGAVLRGMVVDESRFAASAMEAGGELALDAMR
eukprot:6463429-Prymnesium_polylepis.1